MTILEATGAALAAAGHLTEADQAAVAVLLRLAETIDHASERSSLDNVSIPTFLRFAESLGLTPAGRVKLGLGEAADSQVLELRGIAGTKPR